MWFLNSENIEIDPKFDPNNEHKIFIRVDPLETKEIARINLKNDWKFKFLYKIASIAPDKSAQEKFILEDQIHLENEIKKNYEYLSKLPIHVLPGLQIQSLLEQDNKYFIDLEFLPNYNSIINSNYLEELKKNFEYLIHWRRPEYFALEFDDDFKKRDDSDETNLRIFNQYEPEPNEIIPGLFPDNHFVSTLSALAEKNDLIRKIFHTKKYSKTGFYQVKLCFNGEWVEVCIDDFFPCKPQSEPLVARSPGNEIWVLILQKAVAKLYDGYNNLSQLNISDYLMLLTGMPSETYDLKEMISLIDKQQMFKKIKRMVDKYNIVVAISKSETDLYNEEKNPHQETENSILIPNMGYSLLKIENETKNHLMTLRKVWYDENRDERIKKLEKENFNSIIEDKEKGLLYFSI